MSNDLHIKLDYYYGCPVLDTALENKIASITIPTSSVKEFENWMIHKKYYELLVWKILDDYDGSTDVKFTYK